MVGLAEGFAGDSYEKLKESLAKNLNRGPGEICPNDVIRNSYIRDGTVVVATALDQLVREKAEIDNIALENVAVYKKDYDLLINKLLETDIPDGITGRLSFNRDGSRKKYFLVIKNFVPSNNTNFSLDTVLFEDPWVIEVRGLMEKESRGGNATVFYYTSDGDESNISTIIFSDGTSNIPPYQRIHLFVRGQYNIVIETSE